MSNDQKTRLKRIFFNAGIFAVASGASAFLTILQQADFGPWNAWATLIIASALKAVQTFAEPPQDIYR